MKRSQCDSRGAGGSRVKLSLMLAFAFEAHAAEDSHALAKGSPTAAIAFDEIARFVPAGTPAPSLGSFREDAAVIAALPPLVIPKQHQLDFSAVTALASVGGAMSLFGMSGAIPGLVFQHAAKAAGSVAVRANMADLNKQKEDYASGKSARQRTGVLAKFAYFHGWSRAELIPGTAKLDKPDQGVRFTVDDASQSFIVARTPPVGDIITATSAGVRGAATLVGVATVETLPEEQVEGIAVRGYRTSGAITITRDSFMCAAGPHHVTETEFVSDLSDPRYDPAQDASAAQPLVTACLIGNTVSHREPGRLVLFRIVMVDDDTPAAFGIALERGNIRLLAEQDEALFQPPPGYSEKH